MEIYQLYENIQLEDILAIVIVFDDNQTIVKWQGKVQSLVIHKSLDEFKEILVIPGYLMANDEVRFHHEPTTSGQRLCHSELANGYPVKYAGEIVFWKDTISTAWFLHEINKGSGHYCPSPEEFKQVAETMKRLFADVTNVDFECVCDVLHGMHGSIPC